MIRRLPLIFLTALTILPSGCARKSEKKIAALGGTAEVERTGDKTRIALEGLGDSKIIEIQPAEVMKNIGIPVYPGAKSVPDSRYLAVNKQTEDRTYTARFETPDRYAVVVDWYAKKLGSKPATVKLLDTRYALVVAPSDSGPGKASAMITWKNKRNTTDINLVRVVTGKAKK